MTLTAPLLFALMAGLSAALFTAGVLRRSPTAAIRRRVQELEDHAAAPTQQPSFAERVLLPMVSSARDAGASLLPGGVERRLSRRLESAGMEVRAGRFLAAWIGFGVLAPVVLLALSWLAGGAVSSALALPLLAWLAGGVALPGFWVARRATARVEVIERSLSDAMDLIVTNVEAGVGLQAALINVAAKFRGPLPEEIDRATREISLGRSRDEALEAMARRTGSREVALFARAIAQAERNGIPIARVLRAQAGELRERRRQAARERANTFPLRITLLTVLFIFPTLFLLLLGPVVLNVLDFFAG